MGRATIQPIVRDLSMNAAPRRMQMIAEVGAENNSTTVLMIPSDFVTLSKSLSEYLRDIAGAKDQAK